MAPPSNFKNSKGESFSYGISLIPPSASFFLKINFYWSVVALHGEGDGTQLQYSCLENPTDRGAWWAAVHRIAEGQTQLSDFTFTFHFHALEKEMATQSSVLAWRIAWRSLVGYSPWDREESNTTE